MQVSVFLALSLDGFLARADGGVDWLEPFQQAGGEDYGFAEFFGSVDALVLGRHTYDTARGFGEWPYTGKRVIVLTHHPVTPVVDETTFAGDLADLLSRLDVQSVRRVYLDGGLVVREALARGLVDDLTLSLIPVTLGAGRPLFGPEIRNEAWELTRCRQFPSGIVQVTYHRRRGEP